MRSSSFADASRMSYLLSCFARIGLGPHRPPAGFGVGGPRSFNVSFLSEAVQESRRASAFCRRSRLLPSVLTRDRVRRPGRQRRLLCWWPPRARSLRQSAFFVFEWPRPRVLRARSSFPVVLRLVLARGPWAWRLAVPVSALRRVESGLCLHAGWQEQAWPRCFFRARDLLCVSTTY